MASDVTTLPDSYRIAAATCWNVWVRTLLQWCRLSVAPTISRSAF